MFPFRTVIVSLAVVLVVGAAGAAPGLTASAGPHHFVLDLGGTGLDLGGTASGVRWTRAGTSNAFAALDATGVRAVGVELFNQSGVRLDDVVLVRDGMRLRTANGRTNELVDLWQFFRLLDTSGDGIIDARDLAWPYLRMFVDKNADGRMSDAEIRPFADTELKEIQLLGGAPREPRTDTYGSTFVDGTFLRRDGRSFVASDVALAPVKPASAARVGGR